MRCGPGGFFWSVKFFMPSRVYVRTGIDPISARAPARRVILM